MQHFSGGIIQTTCGINPFWFIFTQDERNATKGHSRRSPRHCRAADRTEQDKKLLVYDSAPLTEDTEVTGHPVVRLYINSTATDGAFFVYLEDVDENGKVTYVTEGMLRALHRKLLRSNPIYKDVVPARSFLKVDASTLVPGKVAQLVFDLLPTSYQFKRNHRIRIAIAGADKNHFALIPEDAPTISVFRNRKYASNIALPVVKAGQPE